jgi:tetratricopeptide (TPR) repeat protein
MRHRHLLSLPIFSRHRLSRLVLSTCLLTAMIPVAWSLGDAPAPTPAGGASAGTASGAGAAAQASAVDQARLLYNTGIDNVQKADAFEAAAAGSAATAAADEGKKSKSLSEARFYYSAALTKFQQAVQLDPKMHQAWNYVGYTHRKLGDYDDALAAYEQALALQPGYPEAIEYRAEAFLALNRIKDAQQAYLDLFATHRAVAGKLLDAMQSWIAARKSASSADLTAVNDLDKWVQERAQIAAQTASLTREGTAASWH